MSQFIEFDSRFRDLLKPGAKLEQLATGAISSEGPVYFHEDASSVADRFVSSKSPEFAKNRGGRAFMRATERSLVHYPLG
jgi:gluconolactonase